MHVSVPDHNVKIFQKFHTVLIFKLATYTLTLMAGFSPVIPVFECCKPVAQRLGETYLPQVKSVVWGLENPLKTNQWLKSISPRRSLGIIHPRNEEKEVLSRTVVPGWQPLRGVDAGRGLKTLLPLLWECFLWREDAFQWFLSLLESVANVSLYCCTNTEPRRFCWVTRVGATLGACGSASCPPPPQSRPHQHCRSSLVPLLNYSNSGDCAVTCSCFHPWPPSPSKRVF